MALNESLHAWQQSYPGPATAVCDYDADGICSAALLHRRLGCSTQVVKRREPLPGLQIPANKVYLLDLSCPEGQFPWPQPTAVIDHHPLPQVIPRHTLLLHKTNRCSAWLTYELLGENQNHDSWIAALGILSDMGDLASCSVLQSNLLLWGKNRLRQITSLINSAYRADGDCNLALQVLLEHDTPTDILRSQHHSVAYLRQCQQKVKQRLGQAQQSPIVKRGQVAVIEFSSDCAIQALVAQIWCSRLNKYVVIAANHRSDKAEIQLSVRSSKGINAIEILRKLSLTVRGHQRSAGATLQSEEWETFQKKFYAYPDQR